MQRTQRESDVHAIDVAELQKGINRILDQLRAHGVEQIPIEQGYYWNIFDDDKFLMDAKPADLGVGDLLYDLRDVESSLDPSYEPPPLLLVALASLLSYVGTRAGDQLHPGK